MADNDEINPVELAGEIVQKALDSEPVKDSLGPAAKNVGAMLGMLTDIPRFYMGENLKGIFTKWAEQREGKPVEPEEFKRVLPFL